jgi:hypothetical protein
VKLRSFVGLRELRRVEPSDTSRGRPCVVRVRAPEAQSREPIPAGARQCADLPELEVPSTGEDPRERPFGRLPGRRPFGRLLRKRPFERLRGVPAIRWPAAAVTARVHRGSKTPTRPLPVRCSRTSSRPRAPLRFLQVYVSTSTTGTARTSRTTEGGRDDCHVGPGELPLWARQPPKVRRVRGREHRASTLPTVIAHGEDFAPTPIASGTSCREHHFLPGPE